MKKLTLSRETVKVLTDAQMSRAAGGSTVIGTQPIDTDRCTGSQCLCTATCPSLCQCGSGGGGPSAPCDQIC